MLYGAKVSFGALSRVWSAPTTLSMVAVRPNSLERAGSFSHFYVMQRT